MTAAVVLDDLVRSFVRTSTNDIGGSTAEDRDGILADILKPDELKVTRPFAVNALPLVSTNYDIAEGRSVLEDEHSIGGTWKRE